MPAFHPLYNFIPLTAQATAQTAYEHIAKGSTEHVRHDLWQRNGYSGRLIASLQLETPTVVGGVHDASAVPTVVRPYCHHNQPALPGNSLRGMIGQIAETLSQSALRVLDNKRYSVRKPVSSGLSLSAIGLLQRNKAQNGTRYQLLPLTIPVQAARTQEDSYQLSRQWQKVFSDGRSELKFCLPAYIKGYQPVGHGDNAKQQPIPDSFLERNPNLDCFLGREIQGVKPQFYYARLAGCFNQRLGEPIALQESALKTKNSNNWNFLLGQKIAQRSGIDDIITQAEYNQLSDIEKGQYTKGILRIFGITGREQAIPSTKKWELFIPLHKEEPLSVPNEVIDTFVQLGHERNKASAHEHPFKPQGYPAWQLESEQDNLAGHLVFFDIAENQAGQIFVREISLSAIWRQAVAGSSYDFFRKINPNLLPWNPERDVLTPAECLFGVVEEEKRSQDKQARALASRVRFSDGRAVTEIKLGHPVTLKILSSPKPPCPALYFHHDQDRRQRHYIAKTELSAQNHRPNGRKVYLHHPQREIERQNWQTRNSDNLDQKMRCQPIQKGQTFYFHIDFDNLSQAELGLLLRSLYPDSTYRHRLGLGKSLGLGTVAVNIEGMFLIDRIKRYESLELDSPRYHQIFSGTTTTTTPAWTDFYPLEAQSLEQTSSPILESCFFNDDTLIEPDTLKILQTVGNPNNLHPNTPVSPPLLLEQRNDPESESFKWFAENEQRDKQAALPLIEAEHTLPTLEQWRGRR